MDMFPNVTALNAFGYGLQVGAHNIANINTNDFTSQTYIYRSGPIDDSGVEFVFSRSRDYMDLAGNRTDDPYLLVDGLWNNDVSLEREMVHMISNQRAYEANAQVIRTIEETSGVILNLVV